jgi:hypothetical protein
MPFRHVVGLNSMYAIQVRIELDEHGNVRQVFHQEFDIAYPIVRIDNLRGEVTFKHPNNKRKYKARY